MGKLKKWLEPTKNKVIVGIVTILIICVGGLGIWSLSKPKAEEPVITFKDNLVFEYGEKLKQDKLLDIIIDKEKSKYDVVVRIDEIDTASVTIKTPGNELDESQEHSYSISIDNQSEYGTEINNNILTIDKGNEKVTFNLKDLPSVKVVITKEGDVLEMTSNKSLDEVIKEKAKTQADKRKGEIIVQLGDIEKSFEFEYDVHDTQAPEFSKVESIDTPYNTEPNFKEILKASDPIDGDLEVKVDGEVDYEKAGSYVIKASASDKNGNTTTISITVNVQEEEIVGEPETQTPTAPNTSGGNISSNGGNSSNGGSSSNDGGTSTKPTEPKPTEPTRPVEPEKPSRPAPDAPSGMVYYKDYGSFDGCSAVIDSLSENNWKTWGPSMCDSYGYLYYTPKN